MKEEISEMAIPHLFRCPISLDLFKDPVTLCTGQTYDRSSIEKWLSCGNQTCPVTMLRLHDQSMVPNHTLRHLIDQWIRFDHDGHYHYFDMINGDDHSLGALKHTLESNESNLETKVQTLAKIATLAEELPSRNSFLIQVGFFPLLVELVFGDLGKGQNSHLENLRFVEQALVCAIKLLPFGNLEDLKVLKEESKLANFELLFNQGTMTIKTSLCHLVEGISSSHCLGTKELCATLGENRGVLKEIILLLFVDDNFEASEAGTKAISALCSFETNRECLVREGAIDGLITYILRNERHERSSVAMAMATIEVLLGLESGKEALINHPNGVSTIIKMVFRVSDHGGSESAVTSLMIIVRNSARAKDDVIRAGVLTQLLLLLQSQCNGRTKAKARMLLKLL